MKEFIVSCKLDGILFLEESKCLQYEEACNIILNYSNLNKNGDWIKIKINSVFLKIEKINDDIFELSNPSFSFNIQKTERIMLTQEIVDLFY